MKKTFLLLIAILFSMSATVDASLITTRPEGTTTILTTVTGYWDFRTSGGGGLGFGEFNFSTEDQFWYGDTGYNLQANGTWESPFAWVGAFTDLSHDYIGSVMIDLGMFYSVVGGFMNYFLWEDGSPALANPTIEALAGDGTTVLESYDLIADAPISTPEGLNAGAFRGISRDTADIQFLRISGSYIVIHDLTLIGTQPVPEPATMLLLGSGILGLLGFRKRFRKG
jgi:hypothetical protein